MTEREQLLNAILEQPDELTPRLVYADKLDELGGAKNVARAEIIRVQCQIEQPARDIIPTKPDHQTADADTLIEFWTQLRARQESLLKTWGASWLPKSLRGGYPHFAVSGNVVASDVLGGSVRFERGFIAHAGIALDLIYYHNPAGSGAPVTVTYIERAEKFARALEAVFRHNPLTGFTTSFNQSDITLTAEIVPYPATETMPARHWRLMWDMLTYETQPSDATYTPVALTSRAVMGREIGRWLLQALKRPAQLVAEHFAGLEDIDVEELESFEEMPDDFVNTHQQAIDAIMRAAGAPQHLINPETSGEPL